MRSMHEIGLILSLSGVLLFLIEIHAIYKRRQINNLRAYVNKDIPSLRGLFANNPIFKDTLAFGAGLVGVNLLQVYGATLPKKELLNYIEDKLPSRYPDMNSIDWYHELLYSKIKDPSEYRNSLNIVKGQLAENRAVDFLNSNGANAELADTVIHGEVDIIAKFDDGSDATYSVKCGSSSYIVNSIENHPEAENFIVNSEAYNYMESNGMLDHYNGQGINIFNGGYSDTEIEMSVKNSFDEIIDAGDITDNIPAAALLLFSIKLSKDLSSYFKHQQTARELGVNTIGNIGRIGMGGVAAIGGAKLGMLVGTGIAPGIGTTIGAGVGVALGATISSSTVNFVKSKIKWGKIIKALDSFADYYGRKLPQYTHSRIIKKYFDLDTLNNEGYSEMQIFKQYQSELNPYSFKKPSLSGVLSSERLHKLRMTRSRINSLQPLIEKKLNEICRNAASCNMSMNQYEKTISRVYWNTLLSTEWLIQPTDLEQPLKNSYYEYMEQMNKSGNHPFKLGVDSDSLLENVVYDSFTKVIVKENDLLKKKFGVFLFALSMLSIVAGLYIVSGQYLL